MFRLHLALGIHVLNNPSRSVRTGGRIRLAYLDSVDDEADPFIGDVEEDAERVPDARLKLDLVGRPLKVIVVVPQLIKRKTIHHKFVPQLIERNE